MSSKLEALQLVTDGDLTVTVDGTDQVLTDLNFSEVTSLADVATILQTALTGVTVTASNNTLIFVSLNQQHHVKVNIKLPRSGRIRTDTPYGNVF